MAGHYFNTVENQVTGKPVNGATILIYEAGATISGAAVTAGTLATIYSDDGITAIDQSNGPIATGANGFYEFWTDETSVVMAILYNGEAKQAIDDVEILGGSISSDVTALAARVDKHDTVFGLAASALDLGTFTGTTISDNTDVVGALQELETAVEATAASSGDLLAANNLSDLANAATARTNLSVYSQAEVDSAIAAVRPVESIIIACSDETTALTTGTGKVTFRMPYAFTLSAVRASVTTAPTDAALIVDINEGGVSILSTKLSIDATEKTSTTAAAPAVISDTALADDAEITIDIDQVGSTVAGAGLKVVLIGNRT